MKIRTFAGISALALAGAAQAAFVGGTLLENTDSSALSTATANGASRVFELFIVFDEADDILNSIGNANFTSSDGASLIQTGVFGATQDTDGDLNPGAWGFVPESQWDSYVAIGGPFAGNSNTTTDPAFSFSATGVAGGWFDVPGEGASRQGVAGNGVDLGGGLWGVFAGQFVLAGSGDVRGGSSEVGDGFINSGAFTGQLDVNWIDAAGSANIPTNGVAIRAVPAPGAAALLGLAGITAGRRRR